MEQRALARSRGSDQRHELGLGNLQAQSIKGGQAPPLPRRSRRSPSSRRGVRAGLIVRPPSIADGLAREVAGDDRGNLIPEAYAVVGATVLRIDLGRVGQVEPGQTGAMIGNPLAVVEGMIGWADRSRKTQDCSIQERLNSGLIRFRNGMYASISWSSGIVKYGWSGSRYFER